MNWLKTLPSTNARIAVTLVLCAATTVRYLGWGTPDEGAEGWFGEWLLFLAAMAGIDALQFFGKRTTYAAPSPDSERANVPPTPPPREPAPPADQTPGVL